MAHRHNARICRRPRNDVPAETSRHAAMMYAGGGHFLPSGGRRDLFGYSTREAGK